MCRLLSLAAVALAASSCRPVVLYTRHTQQARPVFTLGADGLRRARSEEGWHYAQALFLPDCDGDGWGDLALACNRSSTCNFDMEGRLEIVSGASLAVIGEYHGEVEFWLVRSRGGDLLMTETDRDLFSPVMKVLDGIRSEARWQKVLDWEEPAFVGDVDGDGLAEVAIGGSRERRTVDGRERRVGSVALLSGRDGRRLWRVHGRRPGKGFGRDVAPAGDWNGDGVPDVVGLARDRMTILSGVDGTVLKDVFFPAEDEMWAVRAIGDIDGDGLEDFLLHEESPREYVRPIVYSSATWEPVDVAAGWRIAWAAANGDLNGDGRDDLVLGRVAPAGGERRLSIYSQAGLVDVRTLHAGEPAWDEVWAADVGRLRDDGPWYVLLAVQPERFGGSGTVVMIEGA